MKKILILAIALTLLSAANLHAQNFEGKITYSVSFISKIPSISSDEFSNKMGDREEYYIKGGNYKSVYNGTMLQWQLYINKDNKLYNEMTVSDTIFWNDTAENDDSIIAAQQKPGAEDILGYSCDILVLSCKSGTQIFYFSPRLKLDAKLYVNHKLANYYEYLKRANAVPLKMFIDNEQFTMIITATAVEPMKLDERQFQLPAGAKTEKNMR